MSFMTRVEQLKDKIKSELLSFKPTINVPYYNAQKLLNEIFESNPAIMIYISSLSYTGSLLGGIFKVTYQNTEIPLSEVARAKTEIEIEDILHNAIRSIELQKFVIVNGSVDFQSVYVNFITFYQGFYSNLLGIETQYKSLSNGNLICVCFRFKYRLGRVKLNMMETAVKDKIKSLNGVLFTSDMRPETKAYIAHNYLARTVTYWLKKEANPLEKSYMQSAYGALINRKCVCQGYAEAYKRILNEQGIICEVICGKVRGSTEHHAWNIVSLDGKEYYHIDVTWDSKGGGVKDNKYFGKSDTEMSADRIWTRRTNMICNGRRNILQEAKVQIAKNRSQYISKGIDKNYLE